jgi:hypothetical protein
LIAKCTLLVPWFVGPGAAVDEGSILSYGQLVFRGYVPGRDLRTLYGPLDPYLVGFALWITNGNFYSERVLGLAFRLVSAGALLLLVRHRGPSVLLASAAILLLMPPQSLSALAVRGAVAATAVAILAASRGRPRAAGIAAGVAVLFRCDWVLPIALGAMPWLVLWPRRSRVRALAGFGLVVALYVPYLVAVGPSNLGNAVRLLAEGERAGRLPLAPVIDPAGGLFYLVLFAGVLLAVAGYVRRGAVEGTVFMSFALVTAGLVPYAIWTEDRSHVLTAAPSLVIAPAAVAVLVERLRPFRWRSLLLAAGIAAAVAPVVFLSVTSAFPPSVPLFPSHAYTVSNDGRTFLVESAENAEDATKALRLVDRIAPYGRLFVGPRDLRDPGSADDYLYYLLPHLRPATFFIVLSAGTTDRPAHRLAAELSRADVLILDSSLDRPARGRGSVAANIVVARDFCLRARFGEMSVYRRCVKTASG